MISLSNILLFKLLEKGTRTGKYSNNLVRVKVCASNKEKSCQNRIRMLFIGSSFGKIRFPFSVAKLQN